VHHLKFKYENWLLRLRLDTHLVSPATNYRYAKAFHSVGMAIECHTGRRSCEKNFRRKQLQFCHNRSCNSQWIMETRQPSSGDDLKPGAYRPVAQRVRPTGLPKAAPLTLWNVCLCFARPSNRMAAFFRLRFAKRNSRAPLARYIWNIDDSQRAHFRQLVALKPVKSSILQSCTSSFPSSWPRDRWRRRRRWVESSARARSHWNRISR